MNAIFSNKGYIKELNINNQNIILPWGVETSDSSGFFTLNEEGCRQKIVKKDSRISKNSISIIIEARLPHSHWELNIDESIRDKSITRINRLTCLEDCQFNDFVSRFRFKKEFVKSIEIANKKLIHKDSNIYNQYPVKKVVVNLVSGKKIEIKIKSYKTIQGLEPVIYARDSGNEWVIHARLFPKDPKIKQIKILRQWYNRAIPQWISNILLKIKPIYNFLWYRGERKGYFPIGAYGLVKGKKGDILELKMEMSNGE